MKIIHGLLAVLLLLTVSCNTSEPIEDSCLRSSHLLTVFTAEDGSEIYIYDDGKAYRLENGECNFIAQYFDPDFFDQTYLRTETGVQLKSGDQFFPAFRSFIEDFEEQTEELDFIITDIAQTDRVFSAFTLQSPSAKSVDEYVALRSCILAGTCDFLDNRFDVVEDPERDNNRVLKLFSVAPSGDMVTSKTSISSTLLFFEEEDDFWFEANFYIDGAYPTTIADFESSFFLESPGPRLIIRDGFLEVENKFNEKLNFEQTTSSPLRLPKNSWFTIKLHIEYDEVNGQYQVWQNDQLIIDVSAPTMPFDIWIQDRLEVGITATQEETTLYIDDIRFSDQEL